MKHFTLILLGLTSLSLAAPTSRQPKVKMTVSNKEEVEANFDYQSTESETGCEIWQSRDDSKTLIRVCEVKPFDVSYSTYEVGLGAFGITHPQTHTYPGSPTPQNQIGIGAGMDFNTRLYLDFEKGYLAVSANSVVGVARTSQALQADGSRRARFSPIQGGAMLTLFIDVDAARRIFAIGNRCQVLGGARGSLSVINQTAPNDSLDQQLLIIPGPQLGVRCRGKNFRKRQELRIATSGHAARVAVMDPKNTTLRRAFLGGAHLDYRGTVVENEGHVYLGAAARDFNGNGSADQVSPAFYIQNEIAFRVYRPSKNLEILPALRYFGDFLVSPRADGLDRINHIFMIGVKGRTRSF